MNFSRTQEIEIEQAGMDRQVCCTYVGDYHVTTCYRKSSVWGDDSYYYETFVWLNGGQDKQRKLAHHSGLGHVETCEKVLQEGEFWNNQEELGDESRQQKRVP